MGYPVTREAALFDPLLEIDSLSLGFRQGKTTRETLSRVCFQVRKGEIRCLVGESGCGKSVTGLSIPGLLPPQARLLGGRILFHGRDLTRLSEEELDAVRGKSIAMIFQDIMGSLNPVLTVGRQMTEGMRRHLGLTAREASERAVELMRKCGIPNPENTMKRFPHMLSGGQRQRVMIAMALSCSPELLIADEPTTALDVTVQLQILQLLTRLREESGMAILFITHDFGVVAEIADRVTVMYAGQCVEDAPKDVLLSAPAHPYTQALLRSVPDLRDDGKRTLYAIPGTVPQDWSRIPGCRFAPRCPYRRSACETAAVPMAAAAEGHCVRCLFPVPFGKEAAEG